MADVLRSCGWCGKTTPDVQRTQCVSCGGALPALPRSIVRRDPRLAGVDGQEVFARQRPPPGPRPIPWRYALSQFLWGEGLGFVGLIFVGIFGLFGVLGCGLVFVFPPVGCPFLAFGSVSLVGGWLILQGILNTRRALLPLRHGTPVEGEVLSVTLDTARLEGGRHPWVFRYAYTVDGQRHEASLDAFDGTLSVREPGEPVWVVTDPEDPTKSDLWPPVR